MPYKFETDKLLMKNEDKRSIKLTLEDRQEIKKLYQSGQYSQRELARKYNVSRRLITFYIDDERYERNKQSFKQRQKTGMYYDKEKQKEYAKNYREHKKELYKKDKLVKRSE